MPSISIPPVPVTVPFIFDVLIIGSGAAGLSAALTLSKAYRVGVLTKDTLDQSASIWAQGGMAAAIAAEDCPQFHARDTLKAGAGLCDPESVNFLVSQAPAQVAKLLAMGVAFDHANQQPALTLEAAHSHPRVLHAADTTGQALVTTLLKQVRHSPNITLLPAWHVLDLWLNPEGTACIGVCVLGPGQLQWLPARLVVLATGGGGQVFAQTTNPAISTGDGVAMAWRAGVTVRDLEFIQFHPTALKLPQAPRFLISEAVRGEGAHLVDAEGRRFVFDYDPAGELAPRDVVSRAIYHHLQATKTEQVWLDLRPIPPARLHYRFPKIIQVCQAWGIDVSQTPIPVSPAAHYWMGGVVTNLYGATDLPGLAAVGETASTGVHGANRLASNSLLECFVFSEQLATLQLPAATHPDSLPQWPPLDPLEIPHVDADWCQDVRRQLPQLVWQSAGISRHETPLTAAIEKVQAWRATLHQFPIGQYLVHCQPHTQGIKVNPNQAKALQQWIELRNLLDIAYLILKSALFRTESRGGHFRSDYPETNPAWQQHTLIRGETWLQQPINQAKP
ncbi:L-aspartate oxidase [Synechococcus sp. PCC 6312]|uniref:L-aspartate oxidase n=1 Tax=Synechococcus sp. (strain ATCC 27167 / PCC 6312) TaxID=195253 RepID=UPI00029F4E56|nr:L-aspartate oxidase [Synechococcus sp. PCC 6312]AFY60057.1 L-aspartate oxidase [Synechococcus sp. PCC 6312]